jgi:hypothetical protein
VSCAAIQDIKNDLGACTHPGVYQTAYENSFQSRAPLPQDPSGTIAGTSSFTVGQGITIDQVGKGGVLGLPNASRWEVPGEVRWTNRRVRLNRLTWTTTYDPMGLNGHIADDETVVGVARWAYMITEE